MITGSNQSSDKRIEIYLGQRPAWCIRAAALKPSVNMVEHSWATRSVTMRTSSGCQAVRREWTRRTRAIFGTKVTGAANVIASHIAVEPSILSGFFLFLLIWIQLGLASVEFSIHCWSWLLYYKFIAARTADVSAWKELETKWLKFHFWMYGM